METSESREQIILKIESTANFRAAKAEKFPNDERNRNSSIALYKLVEYLETLPKDHPVFDKIYNLNEDEDREFDNRLSRYSFDGTEDPAHFILCEMNLKVTKINEN